MNHRIRAAAIITQANKILLVQHIHPETKKEWWVPPGGGVESKDKTVFDCVKREVFEETGLQVVLAGVVYIREFIDLENNERNLELFINTAGFSGEPTMINVKGAGPDEHFIRDVKWISREDMADLVVYPEILKIGFWKDLSEGFPITKYLGAQTG